MKEWQKDLLIIVIAIPMTLGFAYCSSGIADKVEAQRDKKAQEMGYISNHDKYLTENWHEIKQKYPGYVVVELVDYGGYYHITICSPLAVNRSFRRGEISRSVPKRTRIKIGDII